MDFFPSILDFAGGSGASGELDGISIKNLLLHGEALPPRDLFWSFNGKHAIRSGEWKLVVTGKGEAEQMELFNLAEDLSEENDLAEVKSEIAAQLRVKLDTWQTEVRVGVERVSP
jgi:arylsulfatase A-like enzyme